MFHRNMPYPLAQMLRYAKHVLLFCNVGSFASINFRTLKSHGSEVAFGGVIVLGNGVKECLWASNVLVERDKMIKYV